MSIEVIKSGMQTSVQDLGRHHQMHRGITQSGAMDELSAALANSILGNTRNHPLLEICLIGPTLKFTQDLTVAVCGAQFTLSINRQGESISVSNNQTIHLKAGDVLIFGKRIAGARAYLALAAEFDLPSTLNSYSTHFLAEFGGYQGRALQNQDTLSLRNCQVRSNRQLAQSMQQVYTGHYLLRCTEGVETDLFSDAQKRQFYGQTYRLGNASNRMGLRLEGNTLCNLNIEDMTSSGLLPGSIQIPPNGQPILSSVDGQTIGGYPRIAHVISADLFALGQLNAGDTINFVKVDINQAHQLLEQQQAWLDQLQFF